MVRRDGTHLAALTAAIEHEIAAHGALRVTKALDLFAARKIT